MVELEHCNHDDVLALGSWNNMLLRVTFNCVRVKSAARTGGGGSQARPCHLRYGRVDRSGSIRPGQGIQRQCGGGFRFCIAWFLVSKSKGVTCRQMYRWVGGWGLKVWVTQAGCRARCVGV